MKNVLILALMLLSICVHLDVNAQNEDKEGTIVERMLYVIDDSYTENLTLSANRNAFHEIIYQLSTTGYNGKKIIVYQDSSCRKIKTTAQILELGKSKETIEYAPDPEYPDELVDTTIIDLFASSSISRYLILFDSLLLSDGSIAYQPIAIGPLFSIRLYRIDMEEKLLFWAKWEDLSPILKSIPFISALNRNGQLTYYEYFKNRLYLSSSLNEKIIVE